MKINEAINKAIENGYELHPILKERTDIVWNYEHGVLSFDVPILHGAEVHYERYKKNFTNLLLDRNFWQALGKGMNWRGTTYIQMGQKINETAPDWKYQWHSLIDALASGKSVEEFFGELK